MTNYEENIQREEALDQMLNTANKSIEVIEELPNSVLKLAVVGTLFDHICETEKLDKEEAWEMLTNIRREINREIGPMYK